MNKIAYSVFLVIILILAACGTSPPAEPPPPPEAPPEPTPIPPTETPEPEPEPLIEPTATPENQIFRDDFTGELQPGWEWENENPDLWTFSEDGWLEIIGEHDSLLGMETQSNLLWYSLPTGDFVITAHLKAKPFENFQQATIYIYENPESYIAINRGYCDICDTDGNGFYMEYKIDGAWGAYQEETDAEDVYLRLESSNDMITGYYAVEEDQWERLGRFGNYFQFSSVGIGVTNSGTTNALVGQFDYFEITKP